MAGKGKEGHEEGRGGGGVLSSWEKDGFPIDVEIVDAELAHPLSTFARSKDLNKSRELVSDHKEVGGTAIVSLSPHSTCMWDLAAVHGSVLQGAGASSGLRPEGQPLGCERLQAGINCAAQVDGDDSKARQYLKQALLLERLSCPLSPYKPCQECRCDRLRR
jgi:hypothetical protein